jgi:hypothetical protein
MAKYPLPAGPWIRSILYFQNSNKPWQNDVWFKVTSSVPSNVDVTEVAAAIDTALQADLTAPMTTDGTYLGNRAYLNNGTYTISARSNVGLNGTSSDTSLPNDVCALVSFSAGVGTRVGRGRLYLSGWDNATAQDSFLNQQGTNYQTAIGAALQGITTLGTVPCKWAVWSRKTNALDIVQFVEYPPLLAGRVRRRPRW